MGRKASISNEQILEAARELFLEQGILVSTATIAARAEVSEGSIFKRFKTKERLFEEAMGIAKLTDQIELVGRAGQGHLPEQLFEVSMELVRFYRELIPRLMLKWAHPCKNPKGFFRGHKEPPPSRILKSLTHYLHEEVRLGRLRNIDPEIMARTMLGGLHQFVFFETVGLNENMPIAAQTYVRGMIDLLLQGAHRLEALPKASGL